MNSKLFEKKIDLKKSATFAGGTGQSCAEYSYINGCHYDTTTTTYDEGGNLMSVCTTMTGNCDR